MAGRFRYALAPLRQTRQWDLDALLRDLGELNAAIAAGEAKLAGLRGAMVEASAGWQRRCAGTAVIAVADFITLNRYAGDLAAQARAAELELAELGAQQDALAAQVAMAQRGLEAVDDHRDLMRAQFVQARLSNEFKDADDQWNTLKTGGSDDDS